MANEKQSSISLSVTSQGQLFSLAATGSETLAGTAAISSVQSVGTAWEAVAIGDCGSADLLAVKNADATNFIQLAIDNAGAKIFAKLTAGRFALIPVDPTATIYAKADTASCDMLVVVVEP